MSSHPHTSRAPRLPQQRYERTSLTAAEVDLLWPVMHPVRNPPQPSDAPDPYDKAKEDIAAFLKCAMESYLPDEVRLIAFLGVAPRALTEVLDLNLTVPGVVRTPTGLAEVALSPRDAPLPGADPDTNELVQAARELFLWHHEGGTSLVKTFVERYEGDKGFAGLFHCHEHLHLPNLRTLNAFEVRFNRDDPSRGIEATTDADDSLFLATIYSPLTKSTDVLAKIGGLIHHADALLISARPFSTTRLSPSHCGGSGLCLLARHDHRTVEAFVSPQSVCRYYLLADRLNSLFSVALSLAHGEARRVRDIINKQLLSTISHSLNNAFVTVRALCPEAATLLHLESLSIKAASHMRDYEFVPIDSANTTWKAAGVPCGTSLTRTLALSFCGARLSMASIEDCKLDVRVVAIILELLRNLRHAVPPGIGGLAVERDHDTLSIVQNTRATGNAVTSMTEALQHFSPRFSSAVTGLDSVLLFAEILHATNITLTVQDDIESGPSETVTWDIPSTGLTVCVTRPAAESAPGNTYSVKLAIAHLHGVQA